jgi:hypothetical protein
MKPVFMAAQVTQAVRSYALMNTQFAWQTVLIKGQQIFQNAIGGSKVE